MALSELDRLLFEYVHSVVLEAAKVLPDEYREKYIEELGVVFEKNKQLWDILRNV